MPLSIPHTEHLVFKNTFLNTIALQFEFPKFANGVLPAGFEERLTAYSQNTFQITPESCDLLTRNMEVKESSGSMQYLFMDGTVQFSIAGQRYRSFADSLLSHVFHLKTYLQKVLLLNNDENVKISMRKVNIWPIRQDSEDGVLQYNDVKDSIFSSELNNVSSFLELDEDEKTVPVCSKFAVSVGDVQSLIRTAFVQNTAESGFYNLVLDTISFEECKVEDIDATILKINDALFDIYMWSVDKQIVELMQKEN